MPCLHRMPSRRRAAPLAVVTLATLAALAACDRAATAPAAGRLVVPFETLPTGVAPAVTVTGPGGFSRAVFPSDTLGGLAAGSYAVDAADVAAAGARYRATPARQMVEVPAGGLATAARVGYAVASARLAITVLGLPAGAPAGIVVRGPDGYARTVAGSATLDLLEPGAYAVAAADVMAGGRTYRATPATAALSLAASATPVPVTVRYGAGGGALDVVVAGLPDGLDAAVAVTGPGGAAYALAASGTLRDLEPGRYTVAATPVGRDLVTFRPAVASRTVDVADGATASVAVDHAGAPLALGLDLVADGLTAPVFLTAPDGDPRLFVVERTGRVRVVRDGALLPTPFLDIRDRVEFVGERGLLGMAFDPAYATTGYLYVYYVDRRGDLALERFVSTPGSDVAGASAGMVLTITHRATEHHGGTVAFGPDGMLYLAPGDGGCCGDPGNTAQNLTSLLGKVLRIDVRTPPYVVPPDNPYVGREGRRPEIWASGLRNPWRFSFDAPAGMLYLADVGENAREEIDVVPATAAGLNYGWRLMEGTACFNPGTGCDPAGTLTRPVHEYTHAEGCSVTGGYVYRGAAVPELAGRYLYADYCRGWVRSLRAGLGGGGASEHRTWAGVTVPRAVSFGRDGAGELYLIGGAQVWRIVRR